MCKKKKKWQPHRHGIRSHKDIWGIKESAAENEIESPQLLNSCHT